MKLQVKKGVPIRELSLTGNRLQYLPPFVGELSALQKLHTDPNLVEPPDHIQKEGLPVVQAYLRKIGSARSSG